MAELDENMDSSMRKAEKNKKNVTFSDNIEIGAHGKTKMNDDRKEQPPASKPRNVRNKGKYSKQTRQRAILMAKQKHAAQDMVFEVQTTLLGTVDKAAMANAAKFLTRSDYAEVVEERAVDRYCGYPLCPNRLEAPVPGKYVVSLADKKVYDREALAKYCGNRCHVASNYFQGQLSEVALWLRSPGEGELKLKLLKIDGPNWDLDEVGAHQPTHATDTRTTDTRTTDTGTTDTRTTDTRTTDTRTTDTRTTDTRTTDTRTTDTLPASTLPASTHTTHITNTHTADTKKVSEMNESLSAAAVIVERIGEDVAPPSQTFDADPLAIEGFKSLSLGSRDPKQQRKSLVEKEKPPSKAIDGVGVDDGSDDNPTHVDAMKVQRFLSIEPSRRGRQKPSMTLFGTIWTAFTDWCTEDTKNFLIGKLTMDSNIFSADEDEEGEWGEDAMSEHGIHRAERTPQAGLISQATRRRVLLEQMNSVVPNVLNAFRLPATCLGQDMTMLLATFRLDVQRSVYFSHPVQLTIATLLLDQLCSINETLREALHAADQVLLLERLAALGITQAQLNVLREIFVIDDTDWEEVLKFHPSRFDM